jgi:DNA polymerase-3 subunit delta
MTESASILFLYGNDELAISRRLKQIQLRFDKEGMNTAHLDASTVNQDELNKAVNAMPFLGEKRLVFLANPSKRSPLPANREKFIQFLLNAPPSTMVILHELVESKDAAKHWLVKSAGKGIKAETYLLPRQWDMPGWIISETKRQNGQMEPAAASRLADYSGEDTRLASQEIAKLLTYVNHARPIHLADVEAVSVYSAEGDVFALVDAISNGNGRSAQKLLHRLLESQDTQSFWGMIIRQFRLLIQAKEILDGGENVNTVQQLVGISAYETKKISTQAQRFTLPELEKIYHDLLEIDEGAKTSQVTIDLALDMLIVQLTQD